MKEKFLKDVEHIISVLRDADYNPYEQLYAYAITGNETYITRKGDARNMVSEMDREQLMQYVIPYVKESKCEEEKVHWRFGIPYLNSRQALSMMADT